MTIVALMDRFSATTRHIRATSRDFVLARGGRALSIEAIARAADVAVGTVYERWSDRVDLLKDTVTETMFPELRETLGSIGALPWDARLEMLLDSEEGRTALRTVAELLFIARDHDDLGPVAHESTGMLSMMLSSREGPRLGSGLNWWLTVLSVGWGTLALGDMARVPISADVARVVRGSSSPRVRESAVTVETPPSPVVEGEDATDEVAANLVAVARVMLAGEADREFSAREVGRVAGVSMNALYRRYGSRADLIRKVLMTDMNEARFAWSEEFLAALCHADPAVPAAEVLTRTLRRVYEDEASMRLLLEVTVAARTDEKIMDGIVGQIRAAVESRTELVRRFHDAGVLSEEISAECVSWFIQAVPIGVRLLASTGAIPDPDVMGEGLLEVCRSCTACN